MLTRRAFVNIVPVYCIYKYYKLFVIFNHNFIYKYVYIFIFKGLVRKINKIKSEKIK